MTEAPALYVGLMSGTSMDGIDAALVAIEQGAPRLLASHQHHWPDAVREQLRAFSTDQPQSLDAFGELDAQAGEIFADAVLALLAKSNTAATAVTAIGSHGQTLRHGPNHRFPFTLQIGDPNRIAQRTGIPTVADFRRRDIAAAGQGAPLVPAFHHACFASAVEDRIIVNIGGIANLTCLLAHENTVTGFDTGPGNRLLDDWIRLQQGKQFDADGAWAASGSIYQPLLDALLADAYFSQAPPKSTGSDYFHLDWLRNTAASMLASISAVDVQATLLELTAVSISNALSHCAPQGAAIFLCGGGAHNVQLQRRLRALLPDSRIATTAALGIDPDWVEAAAFAWLAYRTLAGLPGNLPSATGASQPVILGGIYRA